MSRLTGADAYGLMEAYNNVYAPQELTEEQVWEEVETWVNDLIEEGYDLSDYTWEEMYEEYLTEIGFNPAAGKPAKPKGEVVNLPKVKGAITGGDVTLNKGYKSTLGGQKGEVIYQKKDNVVTRSFRPSKYKSSSDGKIYADYNDAKAAHNSRLKSLAATQAASRGGSGGSETSTTPPTRTPAAAPAKVSPTPTKPSLGPTGKPLVGGIERRTPTRAEMGSAKAYRTPAATTGTLGAATADATKPAAFGSTSTAPEVKATNTAAAKTTPTPVTPKPNLQQSIKASRGLPTVSSSYEYDAYDLVLEYLLSEGHADTVEEAHYVMIEMDAETIGSIIEEEERRDPRGRVSSGPMNVYRKSEGKPSQEHLDAVAAHRESEKKKSPEQKKKELDAYIQRQRENK